MGLCKEFYTILHQGGGRSTAVKSQAKRAEEFMVRHVRERMFVTEGEANRFFLTGQARRWHDCQACPLARQRKRVVFGSGSCGSDLLIVGEAPGEQEDENGTPFYPKAPCGALLRRVLNLVGISPDAAFITNAVGCRPPGNRAPEPSERRACEARVVGIAEILRPRVILLLGKTASKWAGVTGTIQDTRGLVPRETWSQAITGMAGIRLRSVVLTYHPSFILHQETKASKQAALLRVVADLRVVKDELDRARVDASKMAVVVERAHPTNEDDYAPKG